MKTSLSPPKSACLILAITGLALSAQAIPTHISGTISMSGTVTMDGTSFLSSTEFTKFENAFVGAPSALSGDYVGTSGAAVTITPYKWSPASASTPITPLWSFISGGNTYSFDLSVLHVDFVSDTGLLLSGIGTAHITGPGVDKKDTTGHWNLSSQASGTTTFTYSSSTTAAAVPDGGSSLALLGAAFLGLGAMGRKLTTKVDLK